MKTCVGVFFLNTVYVHNKLLAAGVSKLRGE